MFLIKFRRDLSTEWARFNPVLRAGEPGYEIDTKRFKIGDGTTRWMKLPYFSTDANEIIESAIEDHINSETPHAVYDDGPSFVLLYQNGKV